MMGSSEKELIFCDTFDHPDSDLLCALFSCTLGLNQLSGLVWETGFSNTLTTVINSSALNSSATVTVHGYYLCRAESALGVDTQPIEISDGW